MPSETAHPPNADPPNAEVQDYDMMSYSAPRGRLHERPEDVAALKESMERDGQLVAVVFALICGVLVLVDGYRRHAALKAAGAKTIRGYVDHRIKTTAQAIAFMFGSEERAGRHHLDLGVQAKAVMLAEGTNGQETAKLLNVNPSRLSHLLAIQDYPPGVQALFVSALSVQHHVVVATLGQERREELLKRAAAERLSAAGLKALAFPRRTRKPDPKVKKLAYGGVGLVFPASLSAAELLAALDEARADAAAKLKAAAKSSLTVKEVFK